MAEAQVAENLPTGRVRRLGSLFGRFGLASLSSAIVSVSHLLVQLFSIHHLETAAIGTLAFLLVIIQFGYGLSNALVSTPYTIAVNQGDDADARSSDFFFPVNLRSETRLVGKEGGSQCRFGW